MTMPLPPANGADLHAARPTPVAQPDASPQTRDASSRKPARASRLPILVRLQDVKGEPLSPLWEGYLYRGKLHLIEGDPGLGKSTTALDLAARVSTGSPMPDGSPGTDPAGVVILSAEDGLADTIRPRLEAAGADLAQIVALCGVSDRPGDLPALPTDLDALEAAILETQAALVIVDPLMAYLDSRVNSWRDQDVRRALGPLKEVAERTGCAVVCVRHLNKSAGTHAVYRGGGSIGLVGAARIALLVAADPDDEQRRVLAIVKNNLSPQAASLAFRLVSDAATGVARVEWLGASDHRPASLLAIPQMAEDNSAVDEAVDILHQILAGGPLPATTGQREALAAGISMATLRRAKRAAGIKPRRVGGLGKDGWWEWQLPAKRFTEGLRCSSPTDEHLRPEQIALAVPDEVARDSRTRCGRCQRPADEQNLITVGGSWKHRHPADCRLGAASTPVSDQESRG